MQSAYQFGTEFLSQTLIFESLYLLKLWSLSLKYQKFALLGCKDIGIRKFDFVVKTQFF